MRDVATTFTSKGQLVIPAEIRRKHGIQAGTKVKVLEDEFDTRNLEPLENNRWVFQFKTSPTPPKKLDEVGMAV